MKTIDTLVINSPENGVYEYEPTSDSDAKSVRDTLRALGVSVAKKEGTDAA